MNDEKKIVSWDELEGVEDILSKTVLLPNLSEKLDTEVHVKIRAIEPLEIVKAFNFPMAEIDQLVSENAEPGKFSAAIQEHAKTFSVQELFETMESVIKTGLVDPEPSGGNLKKLSLDFETIFTEIVGMTTPKEAADQASKFRPDGE